MSFMSTTPTESTIIMPSLNNSMKATPSDVVKPIILNNRALPVSVSHNHAGTKGMNIRADSRGCIIRH